VAVIDELVAIFDARGNRVGSRPRSVMRAEGLWHASTAILVRSTDGARVYVHKRSDSKDFAPGMYDCWAGGVLGADEDPASCAERELAEELGISGVPVEPLFTATYLRPPVRAHMFAFEARWDGPVVWQPEEVVAGGWMELSELRSRLADPGWPFVPDGRQLIERWFRRQDGLSPPAAVPPGSAHPG
jgi:8-oxo-dGTP pyrophosphatase MutT (NUDIX family)